MATQTKRKLIFPPNTRLATRERVKALAYLANLRNRKPWVDHGNKYGIMPQIRQELAAIGYDDGSLHEGAWRMALTWLEDHDYAIRVVDGRAKRTLEFAFQDDVDLSGFKPARLRMEDAEMAPVTKPANKAAQNGKAGEVKAYTATKDPVVAEGLAKGQLAIPVPGFVKPPPPHLEAIVELLEQYFDTHPKEYEQWAEAARAALKARLSDS